ncbi:MAG: hypothetical protein K0S23_3200 [Fluviicola sp.]|uniref:hypothetical protein n=1 Tax=Fluviicola sp. TaxID=1917219 RepID=UPI00262C2D80|nr:hypothetical protein [Fluviicola sp.]MDF3028893.1 hypothetical protein [Fluviicola sp.]
MKNLIYSCLVGISVFFLLLLTACYHKEKVSPELIIRKSSVYNYEIELPVHHEGRGNMHQLDLSKYSFEDSDWLYLNTKEGRVNYTGIILTHERYKVHYPSCQSNLRGYVRFQKDSLKIRLIVPHYIDQDTIVDEWNNFEYNGDYKLKRVGENYGSNGVKKI